MPERIAKFLARSGVCSRREAEELIKQGRITVNGETVTVPAFWVNGTETVLFDGEKIKSKGKTRLWLYHKPAGLITSHKDEKGRDTVFAHLPDGLPRVISVGRLDLNSEGLLLLTNDGELSRALELPSNGWTRRYKVKVHGFLDERRLKRLEKGVTVDGVAYSPCKITIDRRPQTSTSPAVGGNNNVAVSSPSSPAAKKETSSRSVTNAWLTVSLTEGKNREIRKLMASVGLEVARLIRLSYGPFQLGSLKAGEVREVPQKMLREQLGSLWSPADAQTEVSAQNADKTVCSSASSRRRAGGSSSCA